jgi:hypothetical protein
MMIPKAHIPVTSEKVVLVIVCTYVPPNAKENWKNEIAARPLGPKQRFIIPMYEVVPLSFAFVTMRRIVQSVI